MEQQEDTKKLMVLKATAVRQAIAEVMGEQRDEIIKRAAAKLTAMGIQVTEADLGAQVS